jgi:hypothetical protein
MSKNTKIVKNMPDDAYRAEVGISQSMLKEMFVSPEHYKHQFTVEREPTPAMTLGSVTHLACFQPQQLASMVAVSQKFDMRKTADKIASEEFNRDNAGKLIVNEKEMALALEMSEKVRSHPTFIDVCSSGDAEVSAFSDVLPYSDIVLKGRMDWINWDKKIVMDLKTTNASLADMFSVKNVMYDNKYNIQAAMYLMLLEHNDLAGFRFIFIFVEKDAPHGVRCFEISEESLKKSKERMILAIENIQHCVSFDNWFGYDTKTTVIDI